MSGVLQSSPEGIEDKRIRDREWWRYVLAEGLMGWLGKSVDTLFGWVNFIWNGLGLINWFLFIFV